MTAKRRCQVIRKSVALLAALLGPSTINAQAPIQSSDVGPDSEGGFIWPSSRVRSDKPHIDKLEQNTRTAEWAQVTRVTIGQRGSRMIRVTGPWMDYVTSVTKSNEVSGRNISHADRQLTLTLDAAEASIRGDMNLKLNISCPPLGYECAASINLPVKVLETGPINSIAPSGIVPANTVVTFDLQGDALGVAKLNARLLSLKEATIVKKFGSTMTVKGKTPSCGYIDVALTDEVGDGEIVYRKGSTLQPVVAGTICGSSLAPPTMAYHYCPPPTHWDDYLKACVQEE